MLPKGDSMTDIDSTQLICVGPYCSCASSVEECDCTETEDEKTCSACDAALKRIYTETGLDVSAETKELLQ